MDKRNMPPAAIPDREQVLFVDGHRVTIRYSKQDNIPMQKQSCREYCQRQPSWEIVHIQFDQIRKIPPKALIEKQVKR